MSDLRLFMTRVAQQFFCHCEVKYGPLEAPEGVKRALTVFWRIGCWAWTLNLRVLDHVSISFIKKCMYSIDLYIWKRLTEVFGAEVMVWLCWINYSLSYHFVSHSSTCVDLWNTNTSSSPIYEAHVFGCGDLSSLVQPMTSMRS